MIKQRTLYTFKGKQSEEERKIFKVQMAEKKILWILNHNKFFLYNYV